MSFQPVKNRQWSWRDLNPGSSSAGPGYQLATPNPSCWEQLDRGRKNLFNKREVECTLSRALSSLQGRSPLPLSLSQPAACVALCAF